MDRPPHRKKLLGVRDITSRVESRPEGANEFDLAQKNVVLLAAKNHRNITLYHVVIRLFANHCDAGRAMLGAAVDRLTQSGVPRATRMNYSF